jgi:hypothetical protein
MFTGITPYKGTSTRVKIFQSVGDIMAGILATHKSYASDYDKIAPRFDGGSTMQICKLIYSFLLDNTHYKIEPNDKQTLRSPAAILALGGNPTHGLDCKSYSLFIGGVLDALNRRGHKIKWCYRFASYRLSDKIPHHVFVVVNPGTLNEIFVDPVIKPFNYQKPYFYKIDKFPPMALYQVSGIGRRKTNRQERKEKKAEAKNRIITKAKKAGKLAVKFAPPTVAARNAFLLLVKLNFNKLAARLALLNQRKPGALQKFWESIGGNYKSLVANIQRGTKKKGAQVGVEPVTTATAAAVTATPILIKVMKLLAEVGIKKEDLQKLAQSVIKKAIDKKAEAEAASTEEEISVEPGDQLAEAEDMPADIPETGEEISTEGESEDGVGNIVDNIKSNPLPWVAGAALAYYLFKGKKRR